MKSRFLLALLLPVVAGVAVVASLPRDASAIPVFARKYGFNCTMCHSSMPRLNDFGMRYRSNGYRLMDSHSQDRTVLESPPPVALRTSAGYVGQTSNAAAATPDLSDFRLNGLDLLSAGLLGRDIGYFMVYVPQMADGRGVAGQDGSLEMASLVFSNLCRSPWLNLRVGRFEPAFVPFSVKRQLGVSPYEVYDASFPGGIAFSETQSGLELSGHGRQPVRYAVGIVDGGGTNTSIDSPADIYGRLACIVGPGEGQTAGQRIGVVGYYGQARPDSITLHPRAAFYRVGVDASLNAGFVNLAGQFLHANDDKSFWGRTAAEDATWWGTFGELTVTPRVDMAGFARVDFVRAPRVTGRDVTRLTAGGRYYFEDNVAIHAEFSQRTVKSIVRGVDDATESFLTARVDFAF